MSKAHAAAGTTADRRVAAPRPGPPFAGCKEIARWRPWPGRARPVLFLPYPRLLFFFFFFLFFPPRGPLVTPARAAGECALIRGWPPCGRPGPSAWTVCSTTPTGPVPPPSRTSASSRTARAKRPRSPPRCVCSSTTRTLLRFPLLESWARSDPREPGAARRGPRAGPDRRRARHLLRPAPRLHLRREPVRRAIRRHLPGRRSESTQWDGVWDAEATRDDHGLDRGTGDPAAHPAAFPRTAPGVWGLVGFTARSRRTTRSARRPLLREGRGWRRPAAGRGPHRARRAAGRRPVRPAALRRVSSVLPARGGRRRPRAGTAGAARRRASTPASRSSTLMLNATLNPDFSQIEADALQIDVNRRYPLLFEEKRPFFLEGADIFDTAFDLVYTRRIADPRFGPKLTGQLGQCASAAWSLRDDGGGTLARSGRRAGPRAAFDEGLVPGRPRRPGRSARTRAWARLFAAASERSRRAPGRGSPGERDTVEPDGGVEPPCFAAGRGTCACHAGGSSTGSWRTAGRAQARLVRRAVRMAPASCSAGTGAAAQRQVSPTARSSTTATGSASCSCCPPGPGPRLPRRDRLPEPAWTCAGPV